MKPEDVRGYNFAKVGDLFLSFKKGEVREHIVVEVASNTVRLDNGIVLSKITGKIISFPEGKSKDQWSYFPGTPKNKERAARITAK
jgi:hypothetical protein